MRTLAWSIPVALAVAAIAYSSALYSVESVKQEAFMMKACVDAGGSWTYSWGRPICNRPR